MTRMRNLLVRLARLCQDRPLCVWLLFFLVSLAIYARTLNAYYVGDDWMLVFERPVHALRTALFGQDRSPYALRPLKTMLLAGTQACFGLNATMIRLVHLLMHSGVAWLVYVASLRLGYSVLQAGIGGVYCLIAQTAPLAIVSNDTAGQIGAGFFGLASLYMVYTSLCRAQTNQNSSSKGLVIPYVGAVLCLGLSLLWKEVGTTYVLLIGVLMLLHLIRTGWTGRRFVRYLIGYFPFVVVMALYLLLRILRGAPGPEAVHMAFGTNVIKNVGMSVCVPFITVASAEVYMGLVTGRFLVPALGAILALLLVGGGLYGLYLDARWGKVAAFLLFGCLALFPTSLMPHVSELYAYGLLPFAALVLGIAYGAAIQKGGRTSRLAASAILVIVFGAHLVSIVHNSDLMLEASRQARTYQRSINEQAATLKEGHTLVILEPVDTSPAYSCYILPSHFVLRALYYIDRIVDRDDIGVQVIRADKLPLQDWPDQGKVLMLDAKGVRQVCRSEAGTTTREGEQSK